MALTYPLTGAQFFDRLRAAEVSFSLPDMREFSEDAGGNLFTSDHGARLWRGSVSIAPHFHARTAEIEALVSLCLQSGASFLAYDRRREYPAIDPRGIILGSTVPVIASLDANNCELTLSGLPAGYVLTAGDHLSFTYGAAPLRYALHRVVVGSVANSAGIMGPIQVDPFLRSGVAVGAAVRLVRPFCKMILSPGSYQPSSGGANRISAGLAFRFQQTLG